MVGANSGRGVGVGVDSGVGVGVDNGVGVDSGVGVGVGAGVGFRVGVGFGVDIDIIFMHFVFSLLNSYPSSHLHLHFPLSMYPIIFSLFNLVIAEHALWQSSSVAFTHPCSVFTYPSLSHPSDGQHWHCP